MKKWMVSLLVSVALSASAQERESAEIGVFLPASVVDGQQRLEIAETLAAKLSDASGLAVTGKSFGRFEDFAQALATGSITVGLVDGWVAGHLPSNVEAIAVGLGSAEKGRLQLVAKTKQTVPSLKGARLAVVRGTSGQEGKFLTNVLFAGDLQAQKHFKLVPVPNAESALQALEAGAADAAVVLSNAAKGLAVAYDGPSFPTAFVVTGKKALPKALQAALLKTPVAPIERFTASRGDELDAVRALTQRGAGRRGPVMAESPIERFDPALIDYAELGLSLPAFTSSVRLPEESPDD